MSEDKFSNLKEEDLNTGVAYSEGRDYYKDLIDNLPPLKLEWPESMGTFECMKKGGIIK